jgi:cytochrome c biogenesis protein CcmG, thiol:disulfide interchange protein DsbE
MGRMQGKSRRSGTGGVLGLALLGAGLLMLGVTAGLILLRPASKGGASAPVLSGAPALVEFAAPEIELTDLHGNAVSLSQMRGQVLLVNNWATWCPPCREEMPVLEAFYQKNRDKNFTLIAIDAGDTREDVASFVETYGLSFPVWLDPQQSAIRAFRNPALPSSYVIDRDGTVRMFWTGAVTMQALESYLAPLLEE